MEAAVRLGHHVRALVRNPAKMSMPPGVEVHQGDAGDAASVAAALPGADILFYCVNVPLPRWRDEMIPKMRLSMEACRASGARFVFPGNVWVFGPGQPDRRVPESHPLTPCSEKGRLRAQAEALLAESGTRHVLVRLPEFYGPNVANQLMGKPFRDALAGRPVTWFGGHLDVTVEYIYIPDAAEAFVRAGTGEAVDGRAFHVAGGGDVTPRQFFGEVIRRAGAGSRLCAIPELATRAVGLVAPQAREFADILHLWSDPILLDPRAYERAFGPVPRTPYAEGIEGTLNWFRAHPEATSQN